ncbi:MAG: ribosome maturation factor RimP [Coriobacteriales bacterium]
MRSKKVEELIDALEPAATEHGFEIVDAEILGKAGSPILRIYIDSLDGDIDLDVISEAQQEWLEPMVDSVDPINGEYVLEVSSPGIDRPLRTREHFERFIGEDVRIACAPVNGRGKFSGVLMGLDGDNVIVECDGTRYSVPFDSIKKANVIGKIEF